MTITEKDPSRIQIKGHVNAVERYSNIQRSTLGRYIEKMRKGVFQRYFSRPSEACKLYVDHGHFDGEKVYGTTDDGTFRALIEDGVGLYTQLDITDPELIEAALNGDFIGWSFGFKVLDRDLTTWSREFAISELGLKEEDILEPEITVVHVNDLELKEISLITRRKTPVFEGNDINVCASSDNYSWGGVFIDTVSIARMPQKANYNYDIKITDLKKEKLKWIQGQE
jgi:phage head maturation protease